MSLLDLFRRAEPPDGAAPAFEATDAAPERQLISSRRERAVNAGSVMLIESLGLKVMHGWLQNRHQTLVPLTLNLRVLSAPQRAVVAGALAGLLLAGRPRSDAIAVAPALRSWLEELGADPASVTVYDQALHAPPTLDHILEQTLEVDVPVYTYMAALTASDPRFPATALLCDVLQARFDLPTNVVRSIVRRYRR